MRHSVLGSAFITSLAIHLGALMLLSLAWGWLRIFSPASGLDATELVMVAPTPQPVIAEEKAEEIAPPAAVTEEGTTAPALPPLTSEPVTPPKVEPIPPSKIIEQPRPKPVPASKPTRHRKPPPEASTESMFAPRKTLPGGTSDPGPRASMSNASQEPAAGNILGPMSARKIENQSSGPVEGGEAGAGNLFDRGDVGVIPGAGVGGGSDAGGRAGQGLGDTGRGARTGGIRSGPGGEGSGEGSGPNSLPTGGYQVKPRYPDSARRKGIEGTVVVKDYITEQGRVEQVQVEQSAGHDDLDQAAVEAVGRWRFQPARRGRQPMAMWVSIPVKFVLNR